MGYNSTMLGACIYDLRVGEGFSRAYMVYIPEGQYC